MPLLRRYVAEFIGTFLLVLVGCGSAVIAATFTADRVRIGRNIAYPMGIGLLGVALAFGLTLIAMSYAIGHISGCHINPAVTIGLWAAKRFPGSDVPIYIGFQSLGAVAGAGVLALIASGRPGFDILKNSLACNGFAEHSPGRYSLLAAFVTELVLTFMFLIIILGATDSRAIQDFSPIAIGVGLTVIHLISIPVTNTSVNPARSLGPAVFVGGWALEQLWLFWVAPILGGAFAGFLYSQVLERSESEKRSPQGEKRSAETRR
ncbi:MAG: aquaporin Z [Calothrix sp. MO_192.B10]|nr:aquaporin Z [Calothrix sp. MO_192.B10]